MSSAPTGWLSCDGSAVSRSTYSDLFAAISTTFGTGDGSTTFNVPDLRGEFIRGWDAGRGIDSGRSFGSAQADEFKAHDHDVSWTAAEGGSGAGSRVENCNSGYINRATETVGGNETRPRNIALLYCIKY